MNVRPLTNIALGACIAALALYPATASASEVVRFTDGRYLEVSSHEIEGQGIRLTIDRGGVIVLPVGQVEKIERGGMLVFRTDESRDEPGRSRRNRNTPDTGMARSDPPESVQRVASRTVPRDTPRR